MDRIEKVKKILEEYGQQMIDIVETPDIIIPMVVARSCKARNETAQQICRLFPPYPDAQWSDREGECFWCKSPSHWIDVCYGGYVCSAKCQRGIEADVKSRSQLLEPTPDYPPELDYPPDGSGKELKPESRSVQKRKAIQRGEPMPDFSKPDEGRLLTLPDYKHTCTRYTTGSIRSQCVACAYEDGAQAQRDLTASIKDVEIAELNEALDYMVESQEVLVEVLEGECQQRIIEVLNIIFWKVPSIAGEESGEWWAAELRDKNIPIEWDGNNDAFTFSKLSRSRRA